MPETHTEARPGFQGSETSRMEATIYRHGDDPIIIPAAEKLPIMGRRAQDELPSLISASTSKSIGPASGSFMLQIKPSRATVDFFDQVVDDDWVDITIYRHDQPWHTMRGLIDEIREARAVTGSGATTKVYNVTGRDFGKIWETTPVWFSPYANDIVTQAIANKVFQARPSVLGNPGQVVQAFLSDFLESIAEHDGPDWQPPSGMPGMKSGSFLQNVTFQVESPYFQNLPARKSFNPGYLQPQGMLWSLAMQFCDPTFTEFYVDLLPDGDPWSGKINAGDALKPEDTKMTVVLRDRPFPVVDKAVVDTLGYSPMWANIPVLTVPRQQIVDVDVGKGGLERFNAYFVATVLHQELLGANAVHVLAPLLDRTSLKRHGIRRMDVTSNVAPDVTDLDFAGMADSQRRIIRDWYCLNPYMLNGSISLGIGRPDIKVGCRVRVPATRGHHDEESYYVEQIGHSWNFGTSVKTSLGVTRGWRGDDDSYLNDLEFQSGEYEIPLLKTDKETGGG